MIVGRDVGFVVEMNLRMVVGMGVGINVLIVGGDVGRMLAWLLR
jgi:hypothetical protein